MAITSQKMTITTTTMHSDGICSARVAITDDDGAERTPWITFAALRQAAQQQDRELSAIYSDALASALAMEERRQNAIMDERTRGHAHSTERSLGVYGYQHDPARVRAADYDPRAAGNIVELEQCDCGAVREIARNAGAQMTGQWQAPHTIALPEHVRERARFRALGVTAAHLI